MAAGGFFRKLRIIFLLLVLAFVAINAWLTKLRATDWDSPLWVVLYPINGDGSAESSRYIATLTEDSFEPIARFVASEGKRYGLGLAEPVIVKLGPVIHERPPQPPKPGNTLEIIWWSLKMRYWARRVTNTGNAVPADVQIFVTYYDPGTHHRLDDSFGLEKGLIGEAKAYAGRKMAPQNDVIIAHELLHTLGATDKYDLHTIQPIYPEGYADPQRTPRFPQTKAEIMAGRIPLSANEAKIPNGLTAAVIGYKTAQEINWTE
jgi:hypothetical protein